MSDSQPPNSNEEPLSFREEFDRRMRSVSERIVSISESIDRTQANHEKHKAEHDKEIAEIRATLDRADKLVESNSKQIAENNKQFGGLGNRFGEFTESIAKPSFERILDERFNADLTASNVKFRDQLTGKTFEIDGLGVSRDGAKIAYIIETKTTFKEADIKQIKRTVESFRRVAGYEDHEICPILTAVNISEEACDRLWKQEGIHVITVTDGGLFDLATPPPVLSKEPKDPGPDEGYRGPPMRMVPGGKKT